MLVPKCQIRNYNFIVHRDRIDFFYLSSRQKFRTVEELIAFYQNVENSDKYWLAAPLFTQKALDKVRSGIDSPSLISRHFF